MSHGTYAELLDELHDLENEAAEWKQQHEKALRLIEDLSEHMSKVAPDSSYWIENLAPRVDELLNGPQHDEAEALKQEHIDTGPHDECTCKWCAEQWKQVKR